MSSEATTRWPLLGVTVIHRHGRIPIGANIVLVLTASAHRAAAFEAAEFLMDYLKTSAPFWKREEGGQATGWVEAKAEDDAGGLALDPLMAKKAVKRGKVSAARAKKSPIKAKAATAAQLVRDAARRLKAARVTFAHGTSDAVAEAAFIVSETLGIHPDRFDEYAGRRATAGQAARIRSVVGARIKTRKPAAYLLNKIYMRGVPFYIDERAIVPRSYLGEILDTHFGDDAMLLAPERVARVLDLCTGSGCLAILAARCFPQAHVDAVDLSGDALEVARRNVGDHKLADRVTLLSGRSVRAACRQQVRLDHLQSALCRCGGNGWSAAQSAATSRPWRSTAVPTALQSSGASSMSRRAG